MNISKCFSAVLFFFGIFLIGCSKHNPIRNTPGAPTETAVVQITDTPLTRTVSSTPTTEPTSTPNPNSLPTIFPTRFPTPKPTLSPTPAYYPDAWISGFMWHERGGLPTIFAGNSSISNMHNTVTYEAINEAVAEDIAQYSLGSLVVLHGDYTRPADQGGHIIVDQIDRVNLPYNEDIPLSASYSSSDFGFSFDYPENWTFEEHDGTFLRLSNYPPVAQQFHGPRTVEAYDPTEILTEIRVIDTTIEEFVENRWKTVRRISMLPLETTITERMIGGLPITQVNQEPSSYYRFGEQLVYFILSLDNDTLLIFYTAEEDVPFVERLIATLSVP